MGAQTFMWFSLDLYLRVASKKKFNFENKEITKCDLA